MSRRAVRQPLRPDARKEEPEQGWLVGQGPRKVTPSPAALQAGVEVQAGKEAQG